MINRIAARLLLCFALVGVQFVVGSSTAEAQFEMREMIRGYAEVYSGSQQGPVFFLVTFTRFPSIGTGRRTLDQVSFDFTGRAVYYDAGSQQIQFFLNDSVGSASFFPVEDSQFFGFVSRRFVSGGRLYCKLDLDRDLVTNENPLTDDYLGGTVTFYFSGGLRLVATFDRQGSFGNRTAKAEFWWMSPKRQACVQTCATCWHRIQRGCSQRPRWFGRRVCR